ATTLSMEAAALRVRASPAAHRHLARHRPDSPCPRARPSAGPSRAQLGRRVGALAAATRAGTRLSVTAARDGLARAGSAQLVKSRVKKFFTLEPKASALCLTLPSLRCCHALLAGGVAAWPDS